MSARNYIECEDAGLSISAFIRPEPLFRKNTARAFLAAAVIAAGAVNLFFFGYITDIHFFGKQNIISAPSITAHRGDSDHAPEKYQYLGHHLCQTKDFGCRFLVRQRLCRGKILLNIELKPTGHEIDYEKNVLSIIEAQHFKDDCIIASKNINSLKKIKQLNPDMTTIYLMTVAYGNLAEMDFADGFSIESSFLSASLVSHIHDAGKTVYAWTVNRESDMERMLRLGVDSLITDNTIKAKETFFSQNLNDTIFSKLRNMFPSMP